MYSFTKLIQCWPPYVLLGVTTSNAWACSACGAGYATGIAFYYLTFILSVTPPIMIGLMLYYLHWANHHNQP